MVLEELKRVFFKEKDSGELYLRKWITFYRIKYPEKEGEIIKVYSHFEEDVSVLADLLKRFSPKSGSDERFWLLCDFLYPQTMHSGEILYLCFLKKPLNSIV